MMVVVAEMDLVLSEKRSGYVVGRRWWPRWGVE